MAPHSSTLAWKIPWTEDRDNGKISLSRRECVARVFKKSAEEVAAEETAAEVSAWMKEAEKKNANVGSIAGAFDKLGL